MAQIRKYNNALALASIGCKEHVHDVFNSTFTIQGKLYHRMGNLLPERGETPKFSQIYFHDSDIDTEVNYRLTHAELDRCYVLESLQHTDKTVEFSHSLFRHSVATSYFYGNKRGITLNAIRISKPRKNALRYITIDTFLQELQSTLHSVNSYVKSFKTAIEVSVEQPDVKLVLHADKKPPQGGHARTYNLPASSEVAALLPGDATGNLDIILRC